MANPEIVVLPDPTALAHEALRRFILAAEESIADRNCFNVALSGGSTPKALFTLLAQGTAIQPPPVNWARVEFYFVDERCVPPDHAESNYRMADETLLSKLPISRTQIHRMKGEYDPEDAAKEYGKMLKHRFHDGGPDLILLGMGDDGHTASLFPGTKAVGETEHRVVANYAEHSTTGKSWRITMTAPFINRARRVHFLVAGQSKAPVLKQVLEGPRDPQRLPSQLINPGSGELIWLVDSAAGAQLTH